MTFPNEITGTFNYPITLGTGTLTVYLEDGTELYQFTETDISIAGNTFTIDISSLPFANGKYYINFTSGLFNSASGQTVSVVDETTWAFEISDGDYNNADYNNNDYFTA